MLFQFVLSNCGSCECAAGGQVCTVMFFPLVCGWKSHSPILIVSSTELISPRNVPFVSLLRVLLNVQVDNNPIAWSDHLKSLIQLKNGTNSLWCSLYGNDKVIQHPTTRTQVTDMVLLKSPPGNSRYGTNPIVVFMMSPVVVDVIVLRYPLIYLFIILRRELLNL